LQEAGVFSNAVQAGQARLEKLLQKEDSAIKLPNSLKADNKQTDTKATETSEVAPNEQHAMNVNRTAAMPPLPPPGLEHLASDLSAKAAANL